MMLLPRLGRNASQAPPAPLEPHRPKLLFQAVDLVKLHWSLILAAILLEWFLWVGLIDGLPYLDAGAPKGTSIFRVLGMQVGRIVHLPIVYLMIFFGGSPNLTFWMLLGKVWGFGVCLLAIRGVAGIFRKVFGVSALT